MQVAEAWAHAVDVWNEIIRMLGSYPLELSVIKTYEKSRDMRI
jgi:hypothetical protein